MSVFIIIKAIENIYNANTNDAAVFKGSDFSTFFDFNALNYK